MLTERTTTLFVSIFYFQKCQTRDYTPPFRGLQLVTMGTQPYNE